MKRGSYYVYTTGSVVNIDDPGSVLDKMKLTFPPSNTSYNVRVQKYNIGNGVAFDVVADGDNVGTYNFELSEERLMSVSGD